jgi:amino acid adenylation domain-containing protein
MNQEALLLEKPAAETATVAGFCIHELFEKTAARHPASIAVVCSGQRIAYAELNRQANRLAHYLRELGAGPEVPIMLYLERSIEMVVAILAVLKSGSAYVPVDLAYPRDRLEFMRTDSEAAIVITQSHLRERAAFEGPSVICLDSDARRIAEFPEHDFESGVRASNAAYVIYTSGSTGKPKGVLVTHHNVVRLLKETEQWFGFNEHDVWPLFHSYAFDVSVFELWGCFFYGGRLVVVPYLVSRSPLEFYELLAREKVTVLNQTPSAFRQLIWAEETAPAKQELALRYVVCAGEALDLQSLKPWFARHGDDRPKVVNMYGITEITVHATFRIIRQSDLESGVGSVIGVPIPDLQIYLVDEELRAVSNGSPGEICVGGAGVARGYLKRPELTAARFIPDPFASQPGAIMYRSGDLAQYNEQGELEYLGRMDHQVKIRGFRVELGEIESALNRHPGIRESVVISLDVAGGEKRLAAYFVPNETTPTVTDLRSWLGQNLPDYMIPAFFVPLPSFPLTTNGKIDRRALPAPDARRPILKADYLPPKTANQLLLAQIWSQVLEVDPVGIRDNLFELGGDSIRSIAILSWAQQKGLRLTLPEIFQHPTIEALAACAEAKSEPTSAEKAQTTPFELIDEEDRLKLPDGIVDAYPIAHLQLGMFYHNELNPASAMYHDVFSFRITSAFSEEKLRLAVQRLASRHPALRTSFHLAGYSKPLQLVHENVDVPLTIEDVSELSPSEQEQAIVTWIEAEKRRPFERSQAPLTRCHVQLQGVKRFQFFLSFHHSCLDGWSLAAVMTEIFQDYAALLDGRSEMLESPRTTYRDFVSLEHQSTRDEQTRQFWAQVIADSEPQPLPRLGEALCEKGEEQRRGPELDIPAATLEGLKRIAKEAGVPLKTVLLAAHLKVMSLYCGQNDVITSLVSNGRPESVDGEKLVGLFLNTLPFRLRLDGGTWLDLVRRTFQVEQRILPHRRFPLAEIQRLNGGRPLFETAFDFVHFHVYRNLQGYRDFDFAEGHYFEANNLTTYTTFMLDAQSSQLQLHIDYDPNVIARKQVEEISQRYLQVLDAMATAPDASYNEADLLQPAERRLLLNEFNRTEQDYPREWCVHQLIRKQCQIRPHAIAVKGNDSSLSYGELADLADCVTRCLVSNGVRAGDKVAVFMDRKPELIAALVGIWQAGAAYVPLDPAFPSERLAFMLADSGASAVLSEKGLRDSVPQTQALVLEIETALAQAGEETCPESTSTPDSLAYVIYTSGSTGRPKGVEVTHRGVVNLLYAAAQTAEITDRDILLAVTTLSFDIAGLELFMPLVLGGTVHLASREIAGDGTQLAQLIQGSGATIMQATPATWKLLLESGWKGAPNLKVFCGGEALSRSLADRLLALTKSVWNFYGPTETTIWSTVWKVECGNRVLIGKPLANTQVYILDENRQPVPPGVTGELYIAGDGIARGYHARPELTAERFVQNHLVSGSKEGRMYRTGDLARYLPDGNIECLGRIDHQVKIRGFRIELGEIEAAIKRRPGIADAVVTARPDASGEARLAGYVVSNNGTPNLMDLRERLRQELPFYMVPARWMVLPQLPLTLNGKVDLRSLPALETQSLQRDYVPADNPEEQAIMNIWAEVLSLQKVSATDNFFDLGTDSLSATRAFARLNAGLNLDLTLKEILEHPTAQDLAVVIQQRRKTNRRQLPPLQSRKPAQQQETEIPVRKG